MKIVVFDLDETLGYFSQFGILWDSLKNISENNYSLILNQKDFNNLLDLYPEYLRPNILNILNYLKDKKKCNSCKKIMIYTNNNGPKEWCKYIINYFNKKLNYELIDQIIAAFKINGKKVEIFRTTHSKTHSDFLKCTKIPINTEICFIDDNFFPEMSNEYIYYINIKPYYYILSNDEIVNRLLNSKYFKLFKLNIKNKYFNDIDFKLNLIEKMNKYNFNISIKDLEDYELDKIIGKYVIEHLNIFFSKNKNNTYKKKNFNTNKTRKLIIQESI